MKLEKNYYQFLGVNPNDSLESIKKSYQKLAMKYHPDRNDGQHVEEFIFLQAAYTTLSDPKAKREYDLFLKSISEQKSHDTINSTAKKKNDETDVFNTSPDTYFYYYCISLEESINGGVFYFKIPNKRDVIQFELKPGVNQSEQILIKTYSETQYWVIINIANHDYFSREGLDLISFIEVDYVDAILGSDALFTHINGDKINISIPPLSNQDREIVIPNQGVQRGNFVGDLILTLHVTLPQKISRKEKQLLESIRESR